MIKLRYGPFNMFYVFF